MSKYAEICQEMKGEDKIFFDIDDDGNIKGLSDVKQACLDIENKCQSLNVCL